MNPTIQTDEQSLNSPENSNSTTIHRTLVEHGLRPINNNINYQNGPSINSSAITAITKQHQDEQHELQELNKKLYSYLNNVHDLETYNGQLLAELDDLTQKWGSDTDKLDATYGPQLKSLRDTLDNSLRDQVHQVLLLKQQEYDLWQTQQRINAFDDDTTNRLNALKQELIHSSNDLERLKKQFDRRSTDLIQQRTNLENLDNEFDRLKNELLNHRLERIMLENELQTLREHAAFQDAIYQDQRKEILVLSKPNIDSSKFYHNELVHAISDIREDFQLLAQTQLKELEEYYRIKTEELQDKIAKENERKRLLINKNQTEDIVLNPSLIIDFSNEYKELKLENNQLQIDLNDTINDLSRIQDEYLRENAKYDIELNQLEQELENKQAMINGGLENNISLRFELSTYRNLLNSEEKRLNRTEQEQQIQTSSSSSNPKIEDYKIQKMSVKKTAKGTIVFDSIDFINDCVIITYDTSTGDQQSLENWTICRQNDQQPEIVYQFPSSFNLQPGQTIRILSKRSPQSEDAVLIADQIDTWGQGQVMVTRLIDNKNEEKANIIQTRVPP